MRARHVVLLVLVSIATNGCVAAGLASGPLMSAVQAVTDRSVERTVPAELGLVWAAVEDVISRNAMRVEDRQREDEAWQLRASAGKITVHARLERVTPRMTKVSLRVETGGLLADRTTGEQLHGQIARVLANVPGEGPEPRAGTVASQEMTTLQNEVRRLRSAMEERRPAEPAEATNGPGPFTVNPRGIVAIPASYGVPTVPRPAAGSSIPAPGPVGTEIDPAARPESAEPATESPLASRLRPANPLTPVSVLTGPTRSD